jgi:dienelactone hydrolase
VLKIHLDIQLHLAALLALAGLPGLSEGAEKPPLDKCLAAPILAPGRTGAELEGNIISRVPPLELPPSGEEWRARSSDIRSRVLSQVVFRGWPEEIVRSRAAVKYLDSATIETGKGYRIRKLLYEPIPGLWIPALLYEPEHPEKGGAVSAEGKVPAVLNVNGHVGPQGKAIDYKQIRCINLAKRGFLALNPEWYAFGELAGAGYSHNELCWLDLCGKSGVALFYLALRGGIDVLLDHPLADPRRVAVTGLSGGGWQTIFLSALDERVKVCAPNAGYIGLATRVLHDGDVGDLEQNPVDLVPEADYTHLTALLVPRPALLIYNRRDDCCFASPRARASVHEPVIPFYHRFAPWAEFSFHENFEPGTHNYGLDNRLAFYRFLGRLWLDPPDRIDDEIPFEGEVRSFDDLKVGIPPENETFHSLAMKLSADLPELGEDALRREPELKKAARGRLRDLLRVPEAKVEARESASVPGGHAWRLRLSSGWTLPAVEPGPGEGAPGAGESPQDAKRRVTILLADAGRASLTSRAEAVLKGGGRVLAADLLLAGECRPARLAPWHFSMLLSNVGLRALGEETAQVLALASWARESLGATEVALEARGRTAGTAALLAAALDGGGDRPRLDGVVEEGAPGSLKDLLRNRVPYQDASQLYAFGLLQLIDMPGIRALARPGVLENDPDR